MAYSSLIFWVNLHEYILIIMIIEGTIFSSSSSGGGGGGGMKHMDNTGTALII
jgi:hypothetical protein